jgi:hypothetical protein
MGAEALKCITTVLIMTRLLPIFYVKEGKPPEASKQSHKDEYNSAKTALKVKPQLIEANFLAYRNKPQSR